jgi:competence protein ComEC
MNFQRMWRVKNVYLIGSFLLSVCVGLFLGKSQIGFSGWWLLFSPFCILVVYKKRATAMLAIAILGLFFGLWRGDLFYQQVSKYNQFYGKTVFATGFISDDPGYNDKQQTEFHLSSVSINGTELPGKVRVRSIQAASVSRGDFVKVEGKINKTLGTSRQGSISFPKISVIKKNTSWVEALRGKFFTSIYSSLPEPQASLGLGYLVGVRSSLPTDFAKAMSVVGLTHIVAVSGYNLTIIVQFVKRFFEKRSAYQTVAFSTFLITGFLVMTGWSPSIMRASIISGFSLLAWYYGRSFHPIVLILLGAAITGFINPLYIWGDVGWYLSFLAFTGVLILSPLLFKTFIKSRKPNALVSIFIETLSAQAFALPYIALVFGEVSLISPLANILVVPFIPFAMLMIFIVGIIGVFSPVAALWVAFPVRAMMTLTVWIIEKLSSISWAQTKLQLNIWQAVAIYTLIVLTMIFLWVKARKRPSSTDSSEINWDLL